MLKIATAGAVVAAILLGSPAQALDKPRGEVILTVKAKGLDHPNSGNTAAFDIDMLEALDGRKATMETPWTAGTVTFNGPYLRSVLAAAGAHGSRMKISALNGFSAMVPMEDADDLDTILATRLDGRKMSVREKGPVFLVYPFDERPALMNEKYFNRSVWQIFEIEVFE